MQANSLESSDKLLKLLLNSLGSGNRAKELSQTCSRGNTLLEVSRNRLFSAFKEHLQRSGFMDFCRDAALSCLAKFHREVRLKEFFLICSAGVLLTSLSDSTVMFDASPWVAKVIRAFRFLVISDKEENLQDRQTKSLISIFA